MIMLPNDACFMRSYFSWAGFTSRHCIPGSHEPDYLNMSLISSPIQWIVHFIFIHENITFQSFLGPLLIHDDICQHYFYRLEVTVLYLAGFKYVCLSPRDINSGEDTVAGQRLPSATVELRRCSRPAEQTQRNATVHPVHGGHEAAVREVQHYVTVRSLKVTQLWDFYKIFESFFLFS